MTYVDEAMAAALCHEPLRTAHLDRGTMGLQTREQDRLLQVWPGHGQGAVEPALEVADKPGDSVAAAAGAKMDPHPVAADVDGDPLTDVQVDSLDGRHVIEDHRPAPKAERLSGAEQLAAEVCQVVDVTGEPDADRCNPSWSQPVGHLVVCGCRLCHLMTDRGRFQGVNEARIPVTTLRTNWACCAKLSPLAANEPQCLTASRSVPMSGPLSALRCRCS